MMNMGTESAARNMALWNTPTDGYHSATEFKETHIILGLQEKSYKSKFSKSKRDFKDAVEQLKDPIISLTCCYVPLSATWHEVR